MDRENNITYEIQGHMIQEDETLRLLCESIAQILGKKDSIEL